MTKTGNDVFNSGLGSVAEFTTSIQVHIGPCDRFKAAETFIGTIKAHFYELISNGLEGQE